MKIAKQKEVLHVKLSQMKRLTDRLKYKVANSQYQKFGVASLNDGKRSRDNPKEREEKI